MPREQTADQVINAVNSWLHGEDAPDDPYAAVAEERRERDWSDLEGEAREFVEKYGAAAMLRCVSEALK